MRIVTNILLVATALTGFTACLPEDEPVAPHQPGAAISGSSNLGTYYQNVYYWDLENNQMVKQGLKASFDIAFTSEDGKYAIVLNTGKFMHVKHMGTTDFASVTDTTGGSRWYVDKPDGNLDSTAIGAWGTLQGDSVISNGTVYCIDLGYGNNNMKIGYKKLRINGANATTWSVTFANLDGTDEHTIIAERDPDYNFTFLSFTNGGEFVNVEPPKADWDVVFTQFTYLYNTVDHPYTPYFVTGVLQNRNVATGADSSSKPFADIVLADTTGLLFSKDRNTIGHDWKWVDIGPPVVYTVRDNKKYVIRSRNNRYFKLHFLDFNLDGVKGNVLFEFQEL